MKRVIGAITVGRSDYGLYLPIFKKIISHPDLDLRIYVAGAHFSPKFGNTIDEIEKDRFPITAKIRVNQKGDSPTDIVMAMGEHTVEFGKLFKTERPDILLVLGDRFEMHAAALAAIPFHIPLAHIHGGELTYGAIDDYFRHSLTKLSSLHFVATKIYAKRIMQMGEEPWRVVVSGAPGIDTALRMPRLSKLELERKYGIDFSRPILLITFHPVTMESGKTREYVTNLLAALKDFTKYNIVFTYPNSDAGNEIIINAIEKYALARGNVFVVKNFGHQGHLSMMEHSAAMVGNSSSGIIEAASDNLPVVNIGARQEGRERGKNVIDVGYSISEIQAGIIKALSKSFLSSLKDGINLYGDGKASERIVDVLAKVDIGKLIPKKFNDIDIGVIS